MLLLEQEQQGPRVGASLSAETGCREDRRIHRGVRVAFADAVSVAVDTVDSLGSTRAVLGGPERTGDAEQITVDSCSSSSVVGDTHDSTSEFVSGAGQAVEPTHAASTTIGGPNCYKWASDERAEARAAPGGRPGDSSDPVGSGFCFSAPSEAEVRSRVPYGLGWFRSIVPQQWGRVHTSELVADAGSEPASDEEGTPPSCLRHAALYGSRSMFRK